LENLGVTLNKGEKVKNKEYKGAANILNNQNIGKKVF
jgi:hypothetical protein